ncbi:MULTISPECIES: O-antigen ligase family protein [unclassified Empedobacter]|uniref:O-antigen ligase family protein n=1 Tax=unclassified Empedobacter TaxID=2643773 RepID=UPI002448D76C|nr:MULTISPECIES: O-antigen ligase family protein [unclassified Empedobacter]MDH0659058.1 O-antigen ligase family protein [Empedobacter sp. GD03865]
MNNLERLYLVIFSIGLFLFSFNQIEIFPFLGEYTREIGAHFFILGGFLMLLEVIKTGKLNIPVNSTFYRLLILFFFIAIICSLINIDNIYNSYFKKTSGLNRLIRQLFALSIPFFIFIPFFWRVISNWSVKKVFITIRRIFFCSLLFSSLYGFFEILYSYFGIYPARLITDFIGYVIPFIKPVYHSGGRISTFAYEPPFYAIYLITISGWMFSYVLTENNLIKKISPSILVLILTFFSGSRTGLLVVFSIFILFILYLYKNNIYRKQLSILFFSSLITVLSLLTFNAEKIIYSINEKIERLDFVSNLKTDVSNKTRFGMQYASLQVFKENPIFGVGFGQQAYYSRFHYPRWSTVNNWEFKELYNNKKEPSFPPGYNIYTRILAEMGILGFICWLSIIIYSLHLCYRFLKSNNFHTRVLSISISISLIGLYINWLQIDTFRVYGVWLNFVILIYLQQKINYQKNE